MIELVVEAGLEAARALASIKTVAWDHGGDHELTVIVATELCAWCGEAEAWHTRDLVYAVPAKCPGFEATERRLTLGPLWTFSGDAACLSVLGEFGVARLVAGR